MGKGDIKTRRGKIANRSYGVRRNRKEEAVEPVVIAKAAKPIKAQPPKARKAKAAEMAEAV